mmetsp:Transcript_25214/g.52329  ORF Transcript_25214/g.52329 Transcript_25214/m.52329 type:complete len:116 (+) Transcript_25214:46-393(+)
MAEQGQGVQRSVHISDGVYEENNLVKLEEHAPWLSELAGIVSSVAIVSSVPALKANLGFKGSFGVEGMSRPFDSLRQWQSRFWYQKQTEYGMESSVSTFSPASSQPPDAEQLYVL